MVIKKMARRYHETVTVDLPDWVRSKESLTKWRRQKGKVAKNMKGAKVVSHNFHSKKPTAVFKWSYGSRKRKR